MWSDTIEYAAIYFCDLSVYYIEVVDVLISHDFPSLHI